MNEKEQLVSFIKEQLGHGMNIDAIKNMVRVQGWTEADIEQAVIQAQGEIANVNSNVPNTPNQTPAYSTINSTPVFTEQPVKGSIFKKVLITVVVLVLLGGASAGAYYYYIGTQTTLSGVIISTIEALSAGKITSGEISTNITVTAKDVGKNYSDLVTDPTSKQLTGSLQDVAFNLAYSGVVNKTSDNKFETSGDLSASIKNPNGGSLGMFGSQEFGLKYKTFSDNMYVNIQSIPSLASTMIPPSIDVTKYLNQWFSIPTTVTDQYSQAYTGDISTTSVSLKDTDKKIIVELFDQSGAFTIVDKKSEKTDKGTAVTALYVKIDWDKLANELVKMNQDFSQAKGDTYLKSDELDLRANMQKVKELPISNSVFKILVGTTDGYIHGFVSSGDLADKTGIKTGDYEMSFMADSFNQTFTIDRPANARGFVEVMMEINTLMSTPSSSVKTSKTR